LRKERIEKFRLRETPGKNAGTESLKEDHKPPKCERGGRVK